jgi:phosphoribosyl-AMP cyclohydrolase
MTATIETTTSFTPKFSPEGLLPAIVTDHQSGDVLMFAYMNQEALDETIATGIAHFWSRSRGKLWKKGEESGNLLKVVELRTDCDQDVLWIAAEVLGNGVACHTGERSCFYRRVAHTHSPDGPTLERAPVPGAKSGDE